MKRISIEALAFLLLLILSPSQLLANETAPRVILLPIELPASEAGIADFYGAALLQALQTQYTVFYGEEVERVIQTEFEKLDCSAESCEIALATEFNTELIADASIARVGEDYLIKLIIKSVLTNQIIDTRIRGCKKCSVLDVVDQLKGFMGTPESSLANTASANEQPSTSALANNGATLAPEELLLAAQREQSKGNLQQARIDSLLEQPVNYMTPLTADYELYQTTPTDGYQIRGTWLYKDVSNGSLVTPTFMSIDSQSGEYLTLPEQTIVDAQSINDKFAAINFGEVEVRVNDKDYFGEFTLILEKATGMLFPLTENSEPIFYESALLNKHRSWYSNDRYSHIADNSRLYMVYGMRDGLHVASFNGEAFEIAKVIDDRNGAFVVDKLGNILRRPEWDSDVYIYVDAAGGPERQFREAEKPRLTLIDGEFHGVVNGSEIYKIEVGSRSLMFKPSRWKSKDYYIWSDWLRVGGYEFNQRCVIYRFDTKRKRITQQHDFSDGPVSAFAGDNTIWCVIGVGSDITRFIVFNMLDGSLKDFTLPGGTIWADASSTLTVISDEEARYSNQNNSVIYSIKADGTTRVVKVDAN